MSLQLLMAHVLAFLFLLCAIGAQAQLTGRVGPTTSLQSKQNRICNVLNYGGSIGSNVRTFIFTTHQLLHLTVTVNLAAGHRPRHRPSLQRMREREPRFDTLRPRRKLQHANVADSERRDAVGVPDGRRYHAHGHAKRAHDRDPKCGRFRDVLEQ